MNAPAADDGAEHLRRILDDVGERWEPDAIDEIWFFPTRRIGNARSTVAVLAIFEDDDERRRIVTARATDREETGRKESGRKEQRNSSGVALEVVEHGSAPANRVARLIDGVLRRLDEELADAPPRAVRVEGQRDRWIELLAEYRDDADGPQAEPAAPPRA